MRPKLVKQCLVVFFTNYQPSLLVGMPGVGKTDLVKQAAEEAGYELLITHPVVDDPIDYKGLPFVVEGKADFHPIGFLNQLMTTTSPLVVFLDDLGQAPPVVQAAAMQLLLNRAINGKKISDYVVFVAATNRPQDRAGVTQILEPVKSRFLTIMHVDAHVKDWSEWAAANGIRQEVIGCVNFRTGLLEGFEPTADMTNSSTPRTIAHVSQILDMDVPEDAKMDLIGGAAGAGFAREFTAFVEAYNRLPDLQEALADPDSINIPNDPILQWAFASSLADHVEPNQVPALCKLVEKLPAEHATLCVKSAIARNFKIARQPAFREWIKNNKRYID